MEPTERNKITERSPIIPDADVEEAKNQLHQIKDLEAQDMKEFEEENKNLIQQGKIDRSVVSLTKKFKYELMRCIKCPILMECSYPRKRLEQVRKSAEEKAQQVYDDEISLDNSAENVIRAASKRDRMYEEAVRTEAHKVLKDDRCIYERQEIMDDLQKFVDAGYDISDPRVYMIVKELIGNILNSGRANKAFTNIGILISKQTPGGTVYYNNPLLEYKGEVSKLIVESLEALDKILKSDEDVKAANDFITHLAKELKLREGKKNKVIDALSNPKETIDVPHETN